MDTLGALVGNLTRDPELRYAPSGVATVDLGLAVNRRWQDRQSQEWQEETSFFSVVCFGELAEHVAESLAKGARVVVLGRLSERRWETPEGDKRSKVEVVATEVCPSLRWASAEITKADRPAVPASAHAYAEEDI